MRLLEDRVAIRPHEPEKKLGSIIIPDAHAKSTFMGTVVAVGQGVRLPDGGWVPLQVKVGDTVLYGFGGSHNQVDGEDLLFFREYDLLAIVTD